MGPNIDVDVVGFNCDKLEVEIDERRLEGDAEMSLVLEDDERMEVLREPIEDTELIELSFEDEDDERVAAVVGLWERLGLWARIRISSELPNRDAIKKKIHK